MVLVFLPESLVLLAFLRVHKHLVGIDEIFGQWLFLFLWSSM
jgi:hypothetical protein